MNIAMIDEPTPFDTLAIWEQHLARLERLRNGTLFKSEMIATAKRQIARKKATAKRPVPKESRRPDMKSREAHT